jgi:hypothetical protein
MKRASSGVVNLSQASLLGRRVERLRAKSRRPQRVQGERAAAGMTYGDGREGLKI